MRISESVSIDGDIMRNDPGGAFKGLSGLECFRKGCPQIAVAIAADCTTQFERPIPELTSGQATRPHTTERPRSEMTPNQPAHREHWGVLSTAVSALSHWHQVGTTSCF